MPQPDDDCADIANTPITAIGRRMHITDATGRRFGASMGCPRDRNGHAHTCLSSAHAQKYGAPLAPAVDVAVDPREPEAGGEKRGHEDRGRNAVMGAADDLQRQANSSSLQEQSESSKEEQPGAEEVALEHERQFEAVCP